MPAGRVPSSAWSARRKSTSSAGTTANAATLASIFFGSTISPGVPPSHSKGSSSSSATTIAKNDPSGLSHPTVTRWLGSSGVSSCRDMLSTPELSTDHAGSVLLMDGCMAVGAGGRPDGRHDERCDSRRSEIMGNQGGGRARPPLPLPDRLVRACSLLRAASASRSCTHTTTRNASGTPSSA